MRKTTVAILVLSVVLALTYCYSYSQAQDTASVATQRIATVNITKIMMQCQEYIDMDQRFQSQAEAIQKELEELGRQADKISEELKSVLEPGSKEYNTQLQKWFEKGAMIEARKKGHTAIMTTERQAWAEMVYKKVLDEVSRTAKARGIDIVLNRDDAAIKTQDISELLMVIRTRIVVHNNPMLDLTASVLESLDQSYAAQKAIP